jgi:hypothetical protein
MPTTVPTIPLTSGPSQVSMSPPALAPMDPLLMVLTAPITSGPTPAPVPLSKEPMSQERDWVGTSGSLHCDHVFLPCGAADTTKTSGVLRRMLGECLGEKGA